MSTKRVFIWPETVITKICLSTSIIKSNLSVNNQNDQHVCSSLWQSSLWDDAIKDAQYQIMLISLWFCNLSDGAGNGKREQNRLLPLLHWASQQVTWSSTKSSPSPPTNQHHHRLHSCTTAINRKGGERKRCSPNFRKEAYKMGNYTLVAYIGFYSSDYKITPL